MADKLLFHWRRKKRRVHFFSEIGCGSVPSPRWGEGQGEGIQMGSMQNIRRSLSTPICNRPAEFRLVNFANVLGADQKQGVHQFTFQGIYFFDNRFC